MLFAYYKNMNQPRMISNETIYAKEKIFKGSKSIAFSYLKVRSSNSYSVSIALIKFLCRQLKFTIPL